MFCLETPLSKWLVQPIAETDDAFQHSIFSKARVTKYVTEKINSGKWRVSQDDLLTLLNAPEYFLMQRDENGLVKAPPCEHWINIDKDSELYDPELDLSKRETDIRALCRVMMMSCKAVGKTAIGTYIYDKHQPTAVVEQLGDRYVNEDITFSMINEIINAPRYFTVDHHLGIRPVLCRERDI